MTPGPCDRRCPYTSNRKVTRMTKRSSLEPPRAGTSTKSRGERGRSAAPSDAELVKVAGASNQVEAEFLQSLLLDEGVPSLLRRTGGSDVPEFLAAGGREVLVPAAQAELAREVVRGVNPGLLASSSSGVDGPKRVLAGLLAAVALVALVICLVLELGI
jgi:Putative prokaryotic signal transducing protein